MRRHRNDCRPAECSTATPAYPSILREYASSGFREEASARGLVLHDLSRFSTRRERPSGEDNAAEYALQRYGERGPYWARKG